MPDEITIQSTTDSPADLRAAMGLPPEEAAAKVETPTPAAPGETPATPATVPSVAAPATPAEPAKKTKSQARIERLVAERKERDDRIKDLEAKLVGMTAAVPAAVPPPVQVPVEATPVVAPATPASKLPRPQENDFTSYDEYQEALMQWKVDSIIEAKGINKPIQDTVRESIAADRQEEQFKAMRLEAAKKYDAMIERGRQKYPDFQTRLDEATPRAPISPPMSDALFNSQIPDEILYHFALNPEDAQRIAQMPAGPAHVEMGRLEARLESKMATSTPATPAAPTGPRSIPASRAPEPINPVGTSPVAAAKNPDEMTYSEFKAFRAKNGWRH